jgi:hypothetical protein
VLDDRETELPLDKSRPYVQHNVWLALLAELEPKQTKETTGKASD